MKRRKQKYVLLVLDLIVLNASFLMVVMYHAGGPGTGPGGGMMPAGPDVLLFPLFSFFVVFIFLVNQLYAMNVYLAITAQVQQILKSSLTAVIGLAALLFFTGADAPYHTQSLLGGYFLTSFTLLVVCRVLIFRPVVRFCCLHNIAQRVVVIVGVTDTGRELARQLGRRNIYGLTIAGFVDNNIPIGTEVTGGCAVLGATGDLPSLIRDRHIEELILCLENEKEEVFLSVLDECAKTRARVVIASKDYEIVPTLIRQEYYGDYPVFGIMNGRPYLGWYRTKRTLDVVLALAGILVLSPVLAAIAIAIKLESPGPVLFRQRRIGRHGVPFTFYKFRSMRVGAERDPEREKRLDEFIRGRGGEGKDTKIVDEGKITRIGRLIRKTSLDELPQLFNVVRGEMSLVGPRPCLPYELSKYADWHRRRLSVNPGCTGVWQVSGRSQVGFRDMVVLDLYYIYNVSFHMDMWLMLKTLPVMAFGTGGR